MDIKVTNPTATPATASTRKAPVYELLAEDLRALDVPIFCLMSDDTMHLSATLDAMGVNMISARQETNAVAMAEGYASASNSLGLALIGRGPATANGMHGAITASRTGARVLMMFGDAPISIADDNEWGPDGKALNAQALLRAAGIRTFVMRSAVGARDTLAQAVAAARRGEGVALLLPVDVQTTEVERGASAVTASTSTGVPAVQRAAQSAIDTAAGVLRNARKPLFVSGIGAHHAGAREAIERLADKVGAVLATSLKAKDLFHGHPDHVGVIGSFSHSAGRRLMEQADCVVVFGASFNQRTTSVGGALPAGAPIIHVDRVRSHIGRWGPADVAVVGDARSVAEQLAEALPDRPDADKPFHSEENRLRLATFDIASDFRPEPTARTLDPRSLALALDKILPPERNLVYDSGNFVQVLPYLSGRGPDHLKIPWDFFSVGLAFGTALGFAKARPGETTVLMVGDGGFLMALSELETTARADIPLVIIVFNDCAYGAELHFLRLSDMPVSEAMFPDVDYAPVAEAFGFRSATIRSLAELDKVADWLKAPDGPVLLDCKINAAICGPYLAEAAGHLKK